MSTRHFDELQAPEVAALNLPDKPDGPGAAAMIAAGIGIFALGFFTTGAEIWQGLKDFLADFQGSRGVGPLAGKTTMAMLVWLASWGVLALLWKGKDADVKLAFRIGAVLGLLGAVMTFPTFFEMFAE